MKIKVIKPFRDINNISIAFQVGSIVEFEEERARRIIAYGLGEEVKAKPKAREKKVEDDQ